MIGILYESDEWSDWKLREELEKALGEPVVMINMEADDSMERALACELLISRVFASAGFRGHWRSARNMLRLCALPGPPMINPARAHAFEISKTLAAKELERSGLRVPCIQQAGSPARLNPGQWAYPCVIKPDCGGRTTHTAKLADESEGREFLRNAPDLLYIVEDYVEPRAGFMTRAELADNEIVLIVKRSIAPNGLSSYHEGSRYELYPDCPDSVREAVLRAARALSIEFGSFDVMEAPDGHAYMIDANSVSNVSEDCAELFGGLDLMKTYAEAIAGRTRLLRRKTC